MTSARLLANLAKGCYACIAGMPCVFWDHLLQYPDQIRDLIAMRREADLHARSSVVIHCAESDMYVATIDDKCAVRYS